jgi:hypothetical protein
MNRTVLALACSLVIGTVMMRRYPFPEGDALMRVLAWHKPWLVQGLDAIWRAMMFSTPFIFLSTIFSLVFIYTGKQKKGVSVLPPFPKLQAADKLTVVLGEVHHHRKFEQVENPTWLTIPDRGLCTGIAVFGGIGTGKTTAVLMPLAKQILSWKAHDKAVRVGGLVLEVKGNFCHHVQKILADVGRADDYVEISLDTEYRYNPLHNLIDEYSLASGIAGILVNLHGRGKEPFWEIAYAHLLHFLMVLHRVANDYVTFLDLYRCALQFDRIKEVIAEAEEKLAARLEASRDYYTIALDIYTDHPELTQEGWTIVGNEARIAASPEIAEELYRLGILYLTSESEGDTADTEERMAKLSAVKIWLEFEWVKYEAKLRTSVVAGITGFLSLFDLDQRLKRIFCAPKEVFEAGNENSKYGKALPAWDQLIESGKVVALNFPIGENPALGRCIGIMMKLDWERAMLARIPRMSRNTNKTYRPCMFLADEYHLLASSGETNPTGDESFFSLSRESKCIPIVATQSISSLRSVLPGESWRTILEKFRTKIFLTLPDDFSATIASELCGKDEQTVISHSTSESGQDARVGWLSGTLQSHKSSVTMNTNYQQQLRPRFQPSDFASLKNAQSIVLAYDGTNPLLPTPLYLKPWYLDNEVSYWDQLASGKL